MNILTKTIAGLLLCAGVQSAYAELVVVVSAKSGAGTMSKDQIADIYFANVKELPGGGQALPLLLNSGAARTEFFEKVLGKNEAQAKAIWSRLVFSGKGSAPREMADSAEVIKAIAANPNCIGIIEKSALNASVKAVFSP